MTKEILKQELVKEDVKFDKIIFHKESPYQKRRYKKEHVGWEAWIYKGLGAGFLITEESWVDEEYRKTMLKAI